MQKVCILMQNCDFESTLKSRLSSRNRPIIGRVAEIDLLSVNKLGGAGFDFSRSKCSKSHNFALCIIFTCADVE